MVSGSSSCGLVDLYLLAGMSGPPTINKPSKFETKDAI
jgi:hypothetical protein